MGKRGQVTVFIVLGLVVVAALAIVIYTKQDALRSQFAKEKAKLVSVPEQAKSVKGFIDSCVNQIADDGITLLASQGGYINIPEDNYPKGAGNPFSNVLEIIPNSRIEVPYWYYETSVNVVKYQVPKKEDMQKELERYIDEHVRDCLDFSKFEEDGYKFSDTEAITQIDIGDESVLVSLNYPLKISLRDFEFTFDKFYTEIESPLGDAYNDAVSIFNGENSETFLENKTLDFMSMYDKIPLNDIDFACNPRVWTKTQVIEDFKQYLEVNVPYIKIKNTDYEISDDLKVFEADAKMVDKKLSANLQYSSNWPFFINFVGEDSELLRGEPVTTEGLPTQFVASLFCMNNYNFVYDVKYPILISLKKGDLIFNFATMVVIDHNQPRINRAQFNYDTDTEDKICEGKAKAMSVSVLGLGDDGNYKPLNDAKVSYQCSNAVCPIGRTKVSGGISTLTEKFPQCLNGYVIAEKEGYNRVKEQFSTTEEGDVTLFLDRIYDVALDARVVDVNGPRVLAEGETVIFNLVNREKDYSTSVIMPGSEKISLIPGVYDITSYVSVESKYGFKLDEANMRNCFDVPASGVLGVVGVTKKKCIDTKIGGTTLNSTIAGGANYKYDFDLNDLSTAKKLTLYSVRNPVPTTMAEIGIVANSLEKNNAKVILPRFEYEK